MSIKHCTNVKAGAAALALAFIMGMAGCASSSAPAAQDSAAQEQAAAEAVEEAPAAEQAQ
jgi:hypothetical protein